MGTATTRWACVSRSSSPRSTTTRSTRSEASTSRSPPPPRATSKRLPCSKHWACHLPRKVDPPASIKRPLPRPPGTRPKTGAPTDGKDLAARQAGAHPEVQDTCIYSLQPLRTPALGVPQVRNLPHLPARAGPQRPHTGDDEVLLVGSRGWCQSFA